MKDVEKKSEGENGILINFILYYEYTRYLMYLREYVVKMKMLVSYF